MKLNEYGEMKFPAASWIAVDSATSITDAGGSTEAMAELNAARAEALQEVNR